METADASTWTGSMLLDVVEHAAVRPVAVNSVVDQTASTDYRTVLVAAVVDYTHMGTSDD